ncbi:hypothetical protein CSW63_07365 [Caulobacter sp. FWC26]|nr:hypothetical protein CSW63_07365 [Caulobacter sp. FWC26]
MPGPRSNPPKLILKSQRLGASYPAVAAESGPQHSPGRSGKRPQGGLFERPLRVENGHCAPDECATVQGPIGPRSIYEDGLTLPATASRTSETQGSAEPRTGTLAGPDTESALP